MSATLQQANRAGKPSGASGAPVVSRRDDLVYGVFRALLIALFRVFFRVRVVGRANCPKRGPLLVVCNHLSEWDPPFFGSFLPWQVHWLAKAELFALLGGRMNGFFRMLHCVPVDRNRADFSAVKEIARLLRGRRPVVVFAEGGTRSDETSLLGAAPALKEGAASMAFLGGTPPILPCLLTGTLALHDWRNWLLRRPLLEVVIGEPFTLDTRDRFEATRLILDRLLALKPLLEQPKPC
ncbi:MAG: 1-acyl-sn-glycerol-3-phosphate acyltransferase [Verrucomicrobiae bacterium]|nr:1-acyl-sn-glycerol-3-phosphate acyltransferase [Verrucomicrobiae bacterium]